jgi:hypothetical protein
MSERASELTSNSSQLGLNLLTIVLSYKTLISKSEFYQKRRVQKKANLKLGMDDERVTVNERDAFERIAFGLRRTENDQLLNFMKYY